MHKAKLLLSSSLLILMILAAIFGISRRAMADDEIMLEGPPACNCSVRTSDGRRIAYYGMTRTWTDDDGIEHAYCNLENCR